MMKEHAELSDEGYRSLKTEGAVQRAVLREELHGNEGRRVGEIPLSEGGSA